MAVRGKRGERPPNKPNGPTEGEPPPAGHNGGDEHDVGLTDEQWAALAFQHANLIVAKEEQRDEAKKEYESIKGECRQLYKVVKSELGQEGVDRVKKIVELRRGDEGTEEKLRKDLRNMIWVAQYMNATPGQQLGFFDDLRPIEDRAFEEGKVAGLAGEPFSPKFGQGTQAFHRFQDGYKAGQEILASAFKPLEKHPEDLGEPAKQPAPPSAEQTAAGAPAD